MAGIQNQYEAAGRARRVMAFSAAADRLIDNVVHDDLINREIALMALIGRLEGDDGDSERIGAWGALGCVAGIRPVADKPDGTPAEETETGKATLTALRAKSILHRCPNDPFARLVSIDEIDADLRALS